MSKSYLIVGANGGVGAALAQNLISKGYTVYATARDASSITGLGSKQFSFDVLKDDATDLIAQLELTEGLAGVAYCVGSIDLKPFKRATAEAFHHSYDLNVLGAVKVLQAAEAALVKGNGSVVLFSSVAVKMGFANHTLISTAKGAVEGLTKSLASEWASKIRVNCIAPSLLDTALAKPLTSSEQMSTAIAKMHPIPRLGQAEDVSNLAGFLLSDESDWITGQIMHVDGGRSSLSSKG